MKARVSAVQFGTGTDVAENLKTCLRMIDEAAKVSPNFIVLPEFSNHCAIYESQEYADNVALDLDGDFLREIATKAITHNTYIKINVTVKKQNDKPTVSNLLYSPEGKLVGRADKQVLMGNENNFCSRAETAKIRSWVVTETTTCLFPSHRPVRPRRWRTCTMCRADSCAMSRHGPA